jgi:uncharacterized DUF497 family protein
MPFFFFVWDIENERHLAAHGVSADELEEVECDPDFVGESQSSGRPIAFGMTSAGRYLACVYELIDPDTVYPIPAFEPEEREK